MSTLKVTNIESPSGGGVKAKITDINGGQLSNRNLIINGAMQVSQRSTSKTGVTGDGYHTVDRARIDLNGLGTHTVTQSTDAPEGFSNSFKVECTTAQTSPASGAYFVYMQRIEGQNLQMVKKGTSNAQQLTVSFYVKSDKTGDYTLGLNDRDNTRNNSKRYTISSADTWEYKTLTFEADTTGAFDNDNAESLRLDFWLASGSDFNSGSLQTGWESTVNANRAVGNVNLSDTVGNNWSITGLQLEVGEVATAFEHRSYGDELHRCKRYFERKSYTGAQYQVITAGVVTGTSTSTNLLGIVYHEVEKRTNPTITSSAAGTFRNNAAGKNDETATSISFSMLGVHNFQIVSGSATAKNAGAAGYISRENLESTVIDIDAEL